MDKIYLKARAKINLTLEILDKREDNYHNLESVFQKINLYDEIYIYKTNSGKFELYTNEDKINNESNIIYKAYVGLKEIYKTITGIKVVLNKRIPMEAGLGGGSTDWARFILGMNKLFNLNMNEKQIKNLAKSLGADVIPCLYNKAIFAEGIGDIITKINTNFKYYILVVKPEISCNTKEMYEKLDKIKKTIKNSNAKNVIHALENKDIELLSNNIYNSFEDVINVSIIKNELIKNGAIGALLSGSGSCVFGIFKNKSEIQYAYNNLKNKYKTFICLSYNSSREKIL